MSDERSVWGDDVGVTWENAPEETKIEFALTRLFWFFRMVDSKKDLAVIEDELDDEVYDQAVEAAGWFGPILKASAEAAS